MYVTTFTEDKRNRHTTEENPYVVSMTELYFDLPKEMLERFIARIADRSYSVTDGISYNIPHPQVNARIDTYDVLKNNKLVTSFGYNEHPPALSLIAANLVAWYENRDLLKEMANFLGMFRIIDDRTPISHKALAELNQILEKSDF